MLCSYLMAFIKAATVRRDARAFTNVAPTMPGIVWPINKLITNAQYGTPTRGLSHNGTHNAGTKMIGSIAHHALSPARRINTMIPVVKNTNTKAPYHIKDAKATEQEIRNEVTYAHRND